MEKPVFSADMIRQVTAHLLEIREIVETLREKTQTLETALANAQVPSETLQFLAEFSEAGRKLLVAENALHKNLKFSAYRGVNYSAIGQQLTELRNFHDQYEDKYRQLWRSALPIQIEAVLQTQNATPESLWERRWGTAGSKAYQLAQNPAIFSQDRLPERLPERLKDHGTQLGLLTLRYADLSLNDVANILSLSIPPVLSSQNALETAIAIELLRDAIPCDHGTADFENLKLSIPAGFSPRAMRYTRLIQAGCGSQSTKILLCVVPGDETATEEDGFSCLGRDEKPDYLALYLLGKNEFRFHTYTSEPHTLKELIASGDTEFTRYLS